MILAPALFLSLVLAAMPMDGEIERTVLSSAPVGAGLWDFQIEDDTVIRAAAAPASMAGVLSFGDAQSQVYRCRFDTRSETAVLIGCDTGPMR